MESVNKPPVRPAPGPPRADGKLADANWPMVLSVAELRHRAAFGYHMFTKPDKGARWRDSTGPPKSR